ncbi:hypothetical protein TSUD_125990 [Trifolium subterraneum]|uniref:Bidirectional sugar transporter SWEET n=1 Tax=Trifolium subterraneum TaxID=3900 RepID=A0A2Z6MC36_TRISU|nr:hypothetical protein TSUD_125990 [Trifolium subterraneum]
MRNVESMPITLTISLILSATVWLVYGFLVKNIYIYLPNVIGLTLGVIQVVVYYYCSHTGRQTDVEVPVIVEIAPVGENVERGGVNELVEQGGRLVEVAEENSVSSSRKRPFDDISTDYPE